MIPNRIPVKEQEPKIRAKNFEEVSYGYDLDSAIKEAQRCIQCKNPKCVDGCPVGVKIPEFIKKIKENDIVGAGQIIAQDSALPAVCGRVCPQETQCEGNCVMGIKFESVNIGKLERFVADTNRKNGIKFGEKEPQNGIKVAVIGSGPSSLTAAGDLAKKGYDVTIFEALHKAGGVLVYGIPEFRLPKDEVVQKEIDGILALGVKIEKNVVVGKTVSIKDLMEQEDFKAVYIGTGAGLPKFMGIEGETANGVFSANEFLTRINLMKAYDKNYNTPVRIGQHAVTVGGGNVAMDAARTALRLGAKSTIVYRRSMKELPARIEEVHHAMEEGVEFNLLTNPVRIVQDDNGNVTGIECIKMELGEPDASGRRRPVEVKGSEYIIQCDTVIMALGTTPNPILAASTKGLNINNHGGIIANEESAQTSLEGVYAGGDVVTGAATVILAMGAGKIAAKAIDKYIKEKYQ